MVRSGLEITYRPVVNVQLHAIPISPWLGRNRFDIAFVLDLADAAKDFQENRALLFNLKIIIGVLVLASAAAVKIRARGRDAMLRRRNNFDDMSAKKIVFGTLDVRFHLFARQNEGHQHNLAVHTRQSISTVNQFFDFQVRSGYHENSIP